MQVAKNEYLNAAYNYLQAEIELENDLKKQIITFDYYFLLGTLFNCQMQLSHFSPLSIDLKESIL